MFMPAAVTHGIQFSCNLWPSSPLPLPPNYHHSFGQAAAKSAFVLVAGGLGERLGYSGIKLALPVNQLTQSSFLKMYADWILAIQVSRVHCNSTRVATLVQLYERDDEI